ncbi:hypothetical protein ANTPLA_LOCUS6675 [Anthophora plagiata]
MFPTTKFLHGSTRRTTTSSPSNNRRRRSDRKNDRQPTIPVNTAILGELPASELRRNDNREHHNFLVDTGAEINLIKSSKAPNHKTISTPKTFLIDNDKHQSQEIPNITIFQQQNIFYMVPDNLALIKDGIVEFLI